MFDTAPQIVGIALLILVLVSNACASRSRRRNHQEVTRLLGTLVAARMRKGDFLCYCGGSLILTDPWQDAEGRSHTALECERCKSLIILPIKKEAGRATG